MSYQDAIMQACPPVQSTLDNWWLDGTFPGQMVEPMPLSEYIVSEANRTGIVAKIIKSTGQLGVAEVTYFQRFLPSELRTNVAIPDCAGGEKMGNHKQEYTFDPNVNIASKKQVVESLDYINTCQNPIELLARHVAKHIEILDRGVAMHIATRLSQSAGKWANSVPGVIADVLTLKSLKTDGESIDPRAHIKIQNALQDSGAPMATPLFGGTTGREYYQASQIGCCSNEGLGIADALSAFGKAYGYDFYLQQAMSASEWLAVAPQAVQLLNWSKASLEQAMGPLFLESANYKLVSFTSPRLGLTYDFSLANDCGKLVMFGAAHVDTIFLPDDKFQAGDNLYGTNGVFKGEFLNCPAPQCPEPEGNGG